MKEYNWRKEREKFRPDFQKESVPEEKPIQNTKKSYAHILYFVLGIVLIAAIVVGCIFIFSKKDSSAKLSEVAEKHKSAVGLVALNIEVNDGAKKVIPIGTAWAFSENKFATNAHVALGLKSTYQKFIQSLAMDILKKVATAQGCKSVEQLLEKAGPQKAELVEEAIKHARSMVNNVQATIIINGSHRKSYTISQVQIHKDYGDVDSKFDPDVAILTIDGKHDNFFKLADKKTLHKLKSGVPIAFLGFPMENLNNSNVNIDNPVASMQSGIVVAVSDFEMKDSGKTGNFLLRHNLPATGGASGSPIFNEDGEVVGLLYGINVIGQVRTGVNGNTVTRAPSGAQINFGVRIDLLEGAGNAVPIKEFIKLQ